MLAPLREYQGEVLRAVLRGVVAGDGGSYSVMFSRQAGKNEVSARLEMVLLLEAAAAGRRLDSIKAAPTFSPQCEVSQRRLVGVLRDSGVGGVRGLVREQGAWVSVAGARQGFLSAGPESHVVGQTVGRLLECDEAQDVGAEKWARDFLPMAASTGAPAVYYGTAWDDGCLLNEVKERNLESERRDGVRRHFEVDWERVARSNPVYGRYVAAERERLGESHPLFQTQYLLRSLAGAGKLLSAVALELVGSGVHDRLAGLPGREGPGVSYVGGLDVAGEDLGSGRDADSTVLSIGRVVRPAAGAFVQEPVVEVVALYAWQGAGAVQLAGAILPLVRDRWGVRRLCVDTTGVGEGLASALARGAPAEVVERIRFTQETKSRLGFGLQAAAGGGRLRLYGPGGVGATERALALEQLGACQSRLLPSRQMAWSVPERLGHDDYPCSLALLVSAASSLPVGLARGRRGEVD